MYKLIQHGQAGDLYYADTNGLEEIVAQENLRFGDRIYCISTNVTYNVGVDEQLHAEGGKTVNFPSVEESLAKIADALYDTNDDTPATTPVPVIEYVQDGDDMVAVLPDDIKTSGGEGPCIFKFNDPDQGAIYMAGTFSYSPEDGAGFASYTMINSFVYVGGYTSSTAIAFSFLAEDTDGTIKVVHLDPVNEGDNKQTINWRRGGIA